MAHDTHESDESGVLRSLSEDEASFRDIWQRCAPFTMTSIERGLALYRAVRYLVERNLPGSLVECGVWRGGSSMLTMLTLLSLNQSNRPIYLFDTFEGMTEPTGVDIDYRGNRASDLLAGAEGDAAQVLARCSLEEVQQNVDGVGYEPSLIHFVKGDVQNTLPATKTGIIALLRLDTDFYQSTLAELRHLYPRLTQHGVLIVDDYGHWQGCRRAVDEYFTDGTHAGKKPARPFFHAIDYTGRIAVRSERNPTKNVERYDFIPDLPATPSLLEHFPSLVPSDPAKIEWPHLRKTVPHIWRTDVRSKKPNIGVLSAEEAVLLHNLARPFAGARALEIGCHLGWSTAHLLAADLRVDAIDPALGEPDHRRAVEESLADVATSGTFRLWAGYSPTIVPAVRATADSRWSFVFIDGNHEADHPMHDAQAVVPYCALTAAVAFHDLTAPAVAAGLAYFKSIGWSIRIYNTMQIMGVAWRGDYAPVDHTPDGAVPDWRLEHLKQFDT